MHRILSGFDFLRPATAGWAHWLSSWLFRCLPGIRRFCLLAALGVVAGCGGKKEDKLVVGMELSYPPFEMTDEQGRPVGVSVDMAKALGDFLGKEVVIENIPFDGLIPALKTGKIDLIISSMTANEERAQSIDFSEPYLRTGICLLVRKNSSIQTAKELDQPDKTVAVKKGTTGHSYAANHVKQARLLVLDKESACVLEVAQGKADAFIYDQISIYQHWLRNKDTTTAVLKPLREESWAVGIRKGNDELRSRVNQFLNEYRAKGGFEQLGEKYLKDQKEAFRELGYTFYF